MINFASFIGIENNMELLREILFVLMLHYQSGVGYAIDMHNKLFGENWSKQVKAYDRLKKEKER